MISQGIRSQSGPLACPMKSEPAEVLANATSSEKEDYLGSSASSSSSEEESHLLKEAPEERINRKINKRRVKIEEEIQIFREKKLAELGQYEKRLWDDHHRRKNERSTQETAESTSNSEQSVKSSAKAKWTHSIEAKDDPPFDRELELSSIFTPRYLPLLESNVGSARSSVRPRSASTSSSYSPNITIGKPHNNVSEISSGLASRRHSSASSINTPLPSSLKHKSALARDYRQKSPKRVTFKFDDSQPVPSRSSPADKDTTASETQMTASLPHDSSDTPPHTTEELLGKVAVADVPVHVSESNVPTESEIMIHESSTSEKHGGDNSESVINVKDEADDSRHSAYNLLPQQMLGTQQNIYDFSTAPSLVQPSKRENALSEMERPTTSLDNGAHDEESDEDVFDMDETIPTFVDNPTERHDENLNSPTRSKATTRQPSYAGTANINTDYSSAEANRAYSSNNPASDFAPSSIRRRSITKYLPDATDTAPTSRASSPKFSSPDIPDAHPSPTHRANPPSSLPISISAPPIPISSVPVSDRTTPLPTPSGKKLFNPFTSSLNTVYATEVAAKVAEQAKNDGTIGVGSVVGGIDGSTGYDEVPMNGKLLGSVPPSELSGKAPGEMPMSFSMRLRMEEDAASKDKYGSKSMPA